MLKKRLRTRPPQKIKQNIQRLFLDFRLRRQDRRPGKLIQYMHHAEVVDVDPERQLLLVGQEARIHGAKLLHQPSATSKN
jgi:hypothetical protein